VLDSLERGTYKGFMERGLSCKSKDSLLDGLPCKKIEAYFRAFKDPLIYNYILLVNDKMYMFTITASHLTENKTKLIEESNKFLNSIRFTKAVKEKQFATKTESTAYKFGYYLIPLLLIIGFVAYIVFRIVRS
jgi:ATP-dependent Zn protease